MKNTKSIVIIVLLIVTVVGFRLYKKYNRQQILQQKNQVNTEQIFEITRKNDSIERAKTDSINRLQFTKKQDSIRNEIKKQRAISDSILKSLKSSK